MSEFVNKINAAFEDRTPREVHAEAWGKTLYIFPLTMLQLETINQESNAYRRALRTIIVRGKTVEGKPVLDEQDFNRLMTHGVDEFGPNEILNIAKLVNSDQVLEADDEIADLEEK